jgi:basic amino acid/polyamine antiporter, APA family
MEGRLEATDTPRRSLRTRDAVAITVGVVLGAGIFVAPAMVAGSTGSLAMFLGVWLVGGLASFIGALCYAELASAFPHAGGDYHYLRRALGPAPSFLFAWARLTVIPTGSIALLAFLFGDHLSQIVPLGAYSTTFYAGALVLVLLVINLLGVRQGTRAQNVLTLLQVAGVLAIIVVGLTANPTPDAAAPPARTAGGLGLALVFVLLTYGGWNEVATLSAEMRGSRRSLGRALIAGLAVITILYVLVNLAFVRVLGLGGMAQSEVVAADMMRSATGSWGGHLLSVLIAISALTSANATLITGARASYAFGRDSRLFSWLGRFRAEAGTPDRALLTIGVISLALIGLGTVARRGFETMVAYTAPVFWFFFLLTGVSLFVLRVKEPDAPRPFRVPLYPLTPILFCLTSGSLLYSSLAYTGIGALVGVAVLAAGGGLWLVERRLEAGRAAPPRVPRALQSTQTLEVP